MKSESNTKFEATWTGGADDELTVNLDFRKSTNISIIDTPFQADGLVVMAKVKGGKTTGFLCTVGPAKTDQEFRVQMVHTASTPAAVKGKIAAKSEAASKVQLAETRVREISSMSLYDEYGDCFVIPNSDGLVVEQLYCG